MPISPTYLHKRGHSVILAGQLAGPRGRGWVGRRLCRPPAGDVGLGAPPRGGALGGRKVGRFLRKRRGHVRPARRSEPYLGDAEGTCGPRGLDPYREVGGPDGPRRRMEAPTVPMFVPAVALDHSDHALSEAKKRAN